MSSFAKAALALASLAAPAGPEVPAPVAAAVAAEIGARWGVAAELVRLEWGAVPAAAVLGAATQFRLVGGSGEGSFVVVFDPARGSPVAVKLRAGTEDTAVVAARALARGVTLAAEDLRSEPRVRWGAPEETAPRPGAGWVTRRPIAAGEVMTETSVSAPQVVRAGDPVRVEWRRGGVSVALEGVALNPAGLGEPVRVRLAGRGGQRSGRASGPGSVRLDS